MKVVLFDFDYTLADSSRGIVKSFMYALEHLNLNLSKEEEIKATIGMPLIDMFKSLHQKDEKYTEEMDSEFLRLYKEEADRVAAIMTEIYSDVEDGLNSLKDKEIKIGIVSTKNRSRIIETINLKAKALPIDIVIGGEDVTEHKPSPEGILKVVSQMDISAEDVIFVGDSYYDYQAAQNAKCKFLAVTNGSTTKENFIKLGQENHLIFNCIYDVCNYILSNKVAVHC